MRTTIIAAPLTAGGALSEISNSCWRGSIEAHRRNRNQTEINGAVSPMNGVQMNMKDATQRVIIRWIHIICSIPIIGYIYSPFDQIPNYAPATRFVFFPVMLLSGLWMWKGHLVRRLVAKASA
jgi:hypothetical protein